MTITEFLEARIAEDADLATKAAEDSDGVWRRGGSFYAADDDECRIEGENMIIYDEGGHGPWQAEHIARHDPARVLAECALKRAIIGAIEPDQWYSNPGHGGYADAIDIAISTLAAVYAAHPDYRQDWAL